LALAVVAVAARKQEVLLLGGALVLKHLDDGALGLELGPSSHSRV